MKNCSLLFAVFCQLAYLLLPVQIKAQEFIRVDYSGSTGSYFNGLAVLANGNYVCVGATTDSVVPIREMLINIYSPTGVQLHRVRSQGFNYEAYAVAATFDGGFVVAGKRNGTSGTNADDFLFNKYNSNGDSIWGKVCTSPVGTPYRAYDIKQMPDSGLVIVGQAIPNATGLNTQYYILRTDAQGNKLWEHQGGTVNADAARNVILTQDGGFLVTGTSDTTYLIPERGFALKLDGNGNQQWFKLLNDFTLTENLSATQTLTGEYLILRKGTNGNSSIYKLSAQGGILSNKVYTDTIPGKVYFNDIITNADGTYNIVGAKAITGASLQFWLLTLDGQLNTLRYKTYGSVLPVQSSTYMGNGLIRTADKGFAMAGRWANHRGVLIKTDSLGNVLFSLVAGNIVADQNENCVRDTGEVFASGKIVKVATANNIFYGYTDSAGKYLVNAYDTGQVEVSWINNDNFWTQPACQPITDTVSILPYDTTFVDLFAKISTFCPRLRVNVNSSRLRRCFGGNTYFVNYCNTGTATANNAYVEINFDRYFTVDSSSIPYTAPTTGNTYRFDIGNLDMNDCGSFKVWGTIDCDSTVLGQVHCVEAHIYPHTNCEPISPGWDHSSISLVSQCLEGDSVKFTVSNVGIGNMSSASSYTVVENNTLIVQANFLLNAGDSLVILLPANGNTYTVIVPQSAGHPGSSAPLRAVEGCGRDNQGTFAIGYFMQFPQDDEDEFIDIQCGPNQGAVDPNEKTPEPLGIGNVGYINATQPLDYTIQFQNTGTDTAFTVVLRDTLPTYLDITTLQLTGASHNYAFLVLDSNVLEWTFRNILLPDSNVNEPLSHGFVSFTIKQKQGNAPGTQIMNRAGIYFDFNAPVITNYTLNTVVDDYKTELETSVSIEELNSKLNTLKLYPNPNTGQFYIEPLEPIEGELSITIFDLAGKQVAIHSFAGNGPHLVDVQNLGAGMYFYSLNQGAENIGNGKLLVEKH